MLPKRKNKEKKEMARPAKVRKLPTLGQGTMTSSGNDVPEADKVVMGTNKKGQMAFDAYDKDQNKIATWVSQQDVHREGVEMFTAHRNANTTYAVADASIRKIYTNYPDAAGLDMAFAPTFQQEDMSENARRTRLREGHFNVRGDEISPQEFRFAKLIRHGKKDRRGGQAAVIEDSDDSDDGEGEEEARYEAERRASTQRVKEARKRAVRFTRFGPVSDNK